MGIKVADLGTTRLLGRGLSGDWRVNRWHTEEDEEGIGWTTSWTRTWFAGSRVAARKYVALSLGRRWLVRIEAEVRMDVRLRRHNLRALPGWREADTFWTIAAIFNDGTTQTTGGAAYPASHLSNHPVNDARIRTRITRLVNRALQGIFPRGGIPTLY